MYRTLARTATSVSDVPETTALPAQTVRSHSCERCVPQLVSDRAKQNPGRIALTDNSIQLTYGELETRTERLANHLQTLGVGPNVLVAVSMGRSALAPLASLAVLKAGGAYLPVDPNYPRERLTFILADSHTRFVLSDSTVAECLPKGGWRLILVDGDAIVDEGISTDRQPRQISPDDLSYVIYTSGSTGTPKGVEITHGNLLNLVFWHRRAFSITADDRATQFASFGFDAAVWELWPHLTAGATVHITPDEVRSSPELLKDWLLEHEITICFVPTALAERLIMLGWPAQTKLRFLLTGADTLHHYPRPGLPFALINNYGPTEATVVATSGPVAAEDGNAGRRPSIGRPIDGAEIYILDECLKPVTPGEVGELCIGGAGVGRGYVNSPELTAKKFVPDHITHLAGRLYRTGDLARSLPDGQIEYLGRTDGMIKIRGYRIEPNEIIAVLNSHPAVQVSAVVDQADEAGNQRLVAYLVLDANQARPNAAELSELLRGRLPEYMVPAVFVALPELPLTPNGKLDREALPLPDADNKLQAENYISPRTLLEEKLSALVANLLGVAQVGVNDNFFLIGGHSLLGTQLIARIRDTFGVELPLRTIFQSPTPALLGQEVERLMVTKIGEMSEDEIQQALGQATSGGGQR
jgi:amino acid adenylation domain-containing protein